MEHLRVKLDWFKATILPHQAALSARVRRLAQGDHEHQDLVAEVLARAYANPNWREVTHGRAYLFTVARNLVIDQTRRSKIVSFETVSEVDLLRSGFDSEAQLCARDELRRVQRILDGLPDQCRRVFIARRIHEKSMAEIAGQMGLSVSTVEKHLGKAIRLFMAALAQQGNGPIEQERRADAGLDRDTGSGLSRSVLR
jgi:RNA polymerase sigma-70 factor (ECF subfamily)